MPHKRITELNDSEVAYAIAKAFVPGSLRHGFKFANMRRGMTVDRAFFIKHSDESFSIFDPVNRNDFVIEMMKDHGIGVVRGEGGNSWVALGKELSGVELRHEYKSLEGAVLRCAVRMKLGEVIEVPKA